MILMHPNFTVDRFDPVEILSAIESAGRVCYKSKAGPDSGTENFIRARIKAGHESILEHRSITVRLIIDRGVSHALVRHRLAAYSQESTQYCNYSSDRLGGHVHFIIPPWAKRLPVGEWNDEPGLSGLPLAEAAWVQVMRTAEDAYMQLVKTEGLGPQDARSVLPTSVKTELIMTCNLREWRHVLRLRTSRFDQRQIRQVMAPLCILLKGLLPCIFEDITPVEAFPKETFFKGEANGADEK